MAKMDSVSDNGLAFTYKVDGDSLTMSNPTGQTYTAKLDGTDAPYKGDPGTTSVSLRRVDKNTLEETDKRDGKVINVSRMTVAADGKSMTIAFDDKLHGTTGKIVAQKQ
jgi:endonuclease YncB( thermonuclease family)